MSAATKILWQGLAVIDAKGRAQLWNGGQTPKLYRSEEQGRYACTDGSTLEEVTIVLGRVVETPSVGTAEIKRQLIEKLNSAAGPRPAPPAGTTIMTSADLVKTGAWGRARDTSAPVDAPPRRRFRPKQCKKCRRSFQPTGGHSLYCEACP